GSLGRTAPVPPDDPRTGHAGAETHPGLERPSGPGRRAPARRAPCPKKTGPAGSLTDPSRTRSTSTARATGRNRPEDALASARVRPARGIIESRSGRSTPPSAASAPPPGTPRTGRRSPAGTAPAGTRAPSPPP